MPAQSAPRQEETKHAQHTPAWQARRLAKILLAGALAVISVGHYAQTKKDAAKVEREHNIVGSIDFETTGQNRLESLAYCYKGYKDQPARIKKQVESDLEELINIVNIYLNDGSLESEKLFVSLLEAGRKASVLTEKEIEHNKQRLERGLDIFNNWWLEEPHFSDYIKDARWPGITKIGKEIDLIAVEFETLGNEKKAGDLRAALGHRIISYVTKKDGFASPDGDTDVAFLNSDFLLAANALLIKVKKPLAINAKVLTTLDMRTTEYFRRRSSIDYDVRGVDSIITLLDALKPIRKSLGAQEDSFTNKLANQLFDERIRSLDSFITEFTRDQQGKLEKTTITYAEIVSFRALYTLAAYTCPEREKEIDQRLMKLPDYPRFLNLPGYPQHLSGNLDPPTLGD